jgi:transposase InsO family protein
VVFAVAVIEARRKYHNEQRPHRALNGLTPKEFAQQQSTMLSNINLINNQFTLA